MFSTQIGNGIALLNERGPAGWFNLIDLDNLDVSDGDRCVLGQLFGEFEEGRLALGINSYEEAGEYGFCMAAGHYDVLTDEWDAAIRSLRALREPF